MILFGSEAIMRRVQYFFIPMQIKTLDFEHSRSYALLHVRVCVCVYFTSGCFRSCFFSFLLLRLLLFLRLHSGSQAAGLFCAGAAQWRVVLFW
jgi:hypothetical protein